MKRVTPENVQDQYQPTLLQPVAPVAATPVITADETPRHLAAPTVGPDQTPAPVLVLPEPVAAPVATKGKGKPKGKGPMQQLALF